MRIMLACNAGMSTSLVVAKMQDAAKAQGKDYKIWAVEQGEIQNELGNFDVLPCVKRNVVGAVNAVSCANMALAGVDYAIPCDEVIDAMGRVGSLLSPDLRETGQGGLAATPTGVKIAQRLAQED